MASEAQIRYITNLAAKKDLSASTEEGFQQWITAPNLNELLVTFNNRQVDQVLTELKKLPWLPYQATTPSTPEPTRPDPNDPNMFHNLINPELTELQRLEQEVRPARYFILDPTDNKEKFYKVTKPEPPARRAGQTIIEVQASDYFYPVSNPTHKLAILRTIQQDPINAMNEYGIRLGVCGNCGRTLTDRGSRLKGIGPICEANILGQPTDEQLALLERLGLRKRNPNE